MITSDTYGVFWKSSPKSKKISDGVLDLFNIQNLYDVNENKSVNSRCVSTLLNTNNWTELVDEECADYAIGTPTLELWAESWNNRYRNQASVDYDTDENGYYLGTDAVRPDYTMDLSKTSGYKDALYYPHSSIYKMCRGYWLASPSAKIDYNLVTVSYNGLIGNEDYTFTSCGLRPVVALKSTITAELNEQNGIWELTTKK